MLPDFVIAKEIFRDELFNFFAKRVKMNNPLAIVPSKSIVEGDSAQIIREDGNNEPFDFHRISTSINYKFDLHP